MENATLFIKEISNTQLDANDAQIIKEAFDTIKSSLSEFEPGILLYGRKKVYWDAKSYLHIVLRHVKQLQIGTFKKKSPFPYKFEELRLLVEQIIRSIEGEIQRFFAECPNKEFKRVGSMSIFFNGDHYCLQIDASMKARADQKEKRNRRPHRRGKTKYGNLPSRRTKARRKAVARRAEKSRKTFSEFPFPSRPPQHPFLSA